MTLEEELQLVEQAKTNIQAFNQIYDYYFDRIFKYCIRRVYVREYAEDITSYVFMKAVENISKFDTSQNQRFGAWLYRSAHNRIVDVFRKNKKQVIKEIDEAIEKDTRQSVSSQANTYFVNLQITEVLQMLNPKYQQVITLKFFSEFSIPEIAEVMELKPKNVSVILHRALNSFQKRFLQKYPESEIYDFF